MTLTQSLLALLKAISRGAPQQTAHVELRERGSASYQRDHRLSVQLLNEGFREDVLPEAVLNILEYNPAPWFLAAGQYGQGSTGPAVATSVLAVRRAFPKVYINPDKPTSKHGRRWLFPAGDADKWTAALPVPPTAVVQAFPDVVVLYALTSPIPTAEAEQLSRSLAEWCGGESVDAFPLPGSRVPCMDARASTVSELHEDRIYTPAALAASRKVA